MMTEMSDNAELLKYSSAVLFVLPSITPLSGSIDAVSASAIRVLNGSQASCSQLTVYWS